jgi:hypothetical protein
MGVAEPYLATITALGTEAAERALHLLVEALVRLAERATLSRLI